MLVVLPPLNSHLTMDHHNMYIQCGWVPWHQKLGFDVGSYTEYEENRTELSPGWDWVPLLGEVPDSTAPCEHEWGEIKINNATSPLDQTELASIGVKCIHCGERYPHAVTGDPKP